MNYKSYLRAIAQIKQDVKYYDSENLTVNEKNMIFNLLSMIDNLQHELEIFDEIITDNYNKVSKIS